MSIGVGRKHISRQKACLYQVYVIISRAFIRKEITLTPTRAVRDMVISCLKPSYLSKQILIGGPGLYDVYLQLYFFTFDSSCNTSAQAHGV